MNASKRTCNQVFGGARVALESNDTPSLDQWTVIKEMLKRVNPQPTESGT